LENVRLEDKKDKLLETYFHPLASNFHDSSVFCPAASDFFSVVSADSSSINTTAEDK
jgi:hypothetical protein